MEAILNSLYYFVISVKLMTYFIGHILVLCAIVAILYLYDDENIVEYII